MNTNELSIVGTPTSDSTSEEALSIINSLSEFWDEKYCLTGEDKGELIEIVMTRLGANDVMELQKLLPERFEQFRPKDKNEFTVALISAQACYFAVQALRAEANGQLLEAWSWISKANYWFGVTVGAMDFNGEKPESASDFAKRGADERHIENRAMKADIFQWLEANMSNFKSMDAAAEGIAGKVAPIKFRTAREWVSQWKKIRSTGTP